LGTLADKFFRVSARETIRVRLPEQHVLHERTERERAAAREGRHSVEEHRDHRSR
jgi:hypothetical protein